VEVAKWHLDVCIKPVLTSANAGSFTAQSCLTGSSHDWAHFTGMGYPPEHNCK